MVVLHRKGQSLSVVIPLSTTVLMFINHYQNGVIKANLAQNSCSGRCFSCFVRLKKMLNGYCQLIHLTIHSCFPNCLSLIPVSSSSWYVSPESSSLSSFSPLFGACACCRMLALHHNKQNLSSTLHYFAAEVPVECLPLAKVRQLAFHQQVSWLAAELGVPRASEALVPF